MREIDDRHAVPEFRYQEYADDISEIMMELDRAYGMITVMEYDSVVKGEFVDMSEDAHKEYERKMMVEQLLPIVKYLQKTSRELLTKLDEDIDVMWG